MSEILITNAEIITNAEPTSYGETARRNGKIFEKKVCELLNNKSVQHIHKFNKYININPNNFRSELISDKCVDNIIGGRKTKSKCDIIIYNNDIPISISVKMTNTGTQWHCSPFCNILGYLKHINIPYTHDFENGMKKFLGITEPNATELIELNKKRSDVNKDAKRYWINELNNKEQSDIISFLNDNKSELLNFSLRTGLCKETKYHSELFLLNKSDYTETGIIDFDIFNYSDLLKKINIGLSQMTKLGNLELNEYIGIQRKGSGTLSARKCIQFKDRGYTNITDTTDTTDTTYTTNTTDSTDTTEATETTDTTDTIHKIKGLSLFACSGIAEYKLKETGVEIILANELLSERCDIYKHFYPDAEIIQGDINTKLDEIISKSKDLGIEFIMATPPCQSFSNAGRKKIKDTRTPLFLSLIKVILAVQPKYVLIENVPTFMSSKYEEKNNETIEEKFIKDLSNLYKINTKILNTKDYEVPQARKRSITLMSLKTVNEWKHPIQIANIITVRDAIGHLPSLESGEISAIHKWHKSRIHNDNHIKWMSYTPTGQTAFNNIVHFPQKDGRKIKGYKTTYKRIDWIKPSPTITMSSGSISSQNNVHPGTAYIKNEETLYNNARALTVYEIMLLTGLDDNWDPPTTNEKLVRDIIGEAVPPNLIYHLVKNITR